MANILALPVDHVPILATSSLFTSLRQRRPPSEDDWQHNEFSFEPFVKRELNINVDTADKMCPRFAQGSCDRGSACPLRHAVTKPAPPHNTTRDQSRRTVCKHWLRSLCKKGDQCDYLHEYDLRKMPECRFYATFGFCNSADECLYVHIDPGVKRRECERYERGFCELGTCHTPLTPGPRCPKKHVRQVACPYYIAGFCPNGPDCNMGHIKARIPTPESRAATPLLTHRPLSIAEAFGGGPGIQELPTDSRTGRAIVSAEAWAAAEEARKMPAAGAKEVGASRRELSEVLCYKCGEYGHFANVCIHSNRPGNRSGMRR